MSAIDIGMFDEVGEVLRGVLPSALGPPQQQVRRYGIKLWFGADGAAASREHYEAQVIGAAGVPGARTLALEIGFHAEHPKAEDNDAVIARLAATEKRWRKVLGPEPVVGAFLGRATAWRRVSETWADPDLSDPDVALEVASRLADYAGALEALRRGRR